MRLTAIVLLLLFAGPANALAADDPDHATAVAKTVIMHGEDPADQGHCTAAVFGQFVDKPGFVAQRWDTTFHAPNGTTRPAGDVLTPPDYGDTYTFGAIVWTAPAGTHWAFVSHSYGDGPGRCDGAASAVKYESLYPDPIVITYEITDACRTARDRLAAAKRTVKKAATKRKRRAAKAKLRKARAAYTKVC